MEIVGRLTANAVVNDVKSSGRKVVNFNVAVNDRYKPKDGEVKNFTTYFNCSYWISSGIAEHLTTGSLVELSGRVSVNAWKTLEGEAKAGLNFHVNNIKLHDKKKSFAVNETEAKAEPVADDLPF